MEDKRGEPWTVDEVDRLFILLNQGLRKRDLSFFCYEPKTPYEPNCGEL